MSTASTQCKEKTRSAKPTPIDPLYYKHRACSSYGHVRNTDSVSFSSTMKTSDDGGAVVDPAVYSLAVLGPAMLAACAAVQTARWLSPKWSTWKTQNVSQNST